VCVCRLLFPTPAIAAAHLASGTSKNALMEPIDIAGWLDWPLHSKGRHKIERPLLWQSPDLPGIENVPAILSGPRLAKKNASEPQRSVKPADTDNSDYADTESDSDSPARPTTGKHSGRNLK
jgi:hypothetical protein